MSKNRQMEALDAGTIDIGFGRFYPHQEGVVVRNVTNERLFLGAQNSRARSFGEQVHCSALRNEPLILFPREGRPSFADEVIGVFKRARRSEEHTSELQSLMRISYAVFCLKKKNKNNQHTHTHNTTKRIYTQLQ